MFCHLLQLQAYPSSATTLHFEFYAESKDDKQRKVSMAIVLHIKTLCLHVLILLGLSQYTVTPNF